MTRALVLGGGGPVGVAWESGLVAGLTEAGVLVAEADTIIGTSAGSIVGAQLALGRTPQSLVQSQLEPARAQGGGGNGGGGAPPAADLTKLMEMMQRAAAGGASAEELRRDIGTFALNADTMPEEEWLGTFGRMGFMDKDAWPERRFVCTAVDAETGEFVTWDRDAGVELGRAVASSCTVPGIFPPVAIGERRYIDGGMRSSTNADLARGHDAVLVVAVTAGSRPGWEAMAEISQRRLEAELEAVREDGGTVELIVPDAGALDAFGPNLMDFERRRPAAEVGLRQGREEAERLREFWG